MRLSVCALLVLIGACSCYANNVWNLLGINQLPGSYWARKAVYCANRDSMLIFGGVQVVGILNTAAAIYTAELYEYKFFPGSWTKYSPAFTPSGRIYMTFTAVDGSGPNECRAVLHGGYGVPDNSTVEDSLSDSWFLSLNNTTPTWSRLVTSGGPGERYASDAVFRRGQIYQFGGLRQVGRDTNGLPLGQASNDFWAFNLGSVDENGTRAVSIWSDMGQLNSTSSQIPAVRFLHSIAVKIGSTPAQDQLVIFAGRTLDAVQTVRMLSDLWVYNFGTNSWSIAMGLRLERSSHVSAVFAGQFYSYGGVVTVQTSAVSSQDVISDLVLVTNLNPVFIPQLLGNPNTPQCVADDGKNGLWCTAQFSDPAVPSKRYDMAAVVRNDQLIIYGGRSNALMDPYNDFWAMNMTQAASSLKLAEADPLGSSDLASTMYFMIAILSMMVVCFMVFVISLRRQRATSPMFQVMMVARPRVVGARQSVIEALPLKTYKKKEADERRASRRQSRRISQLSSRQLNPEETSTETSQGVRESPASAAVVVANPAAENDKIEEDDLHDLCAICLTDYEDGEQLRVLPCDHFFHPPCVDQWLRTHNACPMCKQAVDPDPERVENNNGSQVVVAPQVADNPNFGDAESDQHASRDGATSFRDGSSAMPDRAAASLREGTSNASVVIDLASPRPQSYSTLQQPPQSVSSVRSQSERADSHIVVIDVNSTDPNPAATRQNANV